MWNGFFLIIQHTDYNGNITKPHDSSRLSEYKHTYILPLHTDNIRVYATELIICTNNCMHCTTIIMCTLQHNIKHKPRWLVI